MSGVLGWSAFADTEISAVEFHLPGLVHVLMPLSVWLEIPLAGGSEVPGALWTRAQASPGGNERCREESVI